MLRRSGREHSSPRPEPLRVEHFDRLAASHAKNMLGVTRTKGLVGVQPTTQPPSLPAASTPNRDHADHEHGFGELVRVEKLITSIDELLASKAIVLTASQRSLLEERFASYVSATAPVVEASRKLVRTVQEHPDMIEEISRANMQQAQDFFTTRGFGADRGNGPIHVTSWDESNYQNASYRPGDDSFRFGRMAGVLLATSGDVVVHEYAHRIFGHAVSGSYRGDSLAISESFSDVIAMVLDPGDWRVGEDAVTNGVRHFDRLATTTISSVSTREPHGRAAVSNAAAYRIANATSREELGDIYVTAVDRYLPESPQFTDLARATWQAAVHLYGAGSAQAVAVEDAWTAVLELDAGSQLFTDAADQRQRGPR
jgi:hypothetical protein